MPRLMDTDSAKSQTRTRIIRRTGTIQGYREDLGNGVTLLMVLIPTGQFTMGSPSFDRFDSEGPQHEVYFPHDFFMGMYPITQTQWKALASIDFTNTKQTLNKNCSQFNGDNLPIEQVNWYEAQDFCDRLTILTKRSYDLPTEAEWEYACRAGTKTPFSFGETITTDIVNYKGSDRHGGSNSNGSIVVSGRSSLSRSGK